MANLTIHKLGEAIVFRCTGRIVFGECHVLRHAVFSHPYIAIAVLDIAEVAAMDAAGHRVGENTAILGCARRLAYATKTLCDTGSTVKV
jgi:hypothetical protein